MICCSCRQSLAPLSLFGYGKFALSIGCPSLYSDSDLQSIYTCVPSNTSISYASSQLAFPRTLPAPEDDAHARVVSRRLPTPARRMYGITDDDDERARADAIADVPLTTRLQNVIALPAVISPTIDVYQHSCLRKPFTHSVCLSVQHKHTYTCSVQLSRSLCSSTVVYLKIQQERKNELLKIQQERENELLKIQQEREGLTQNPARERE